jgi:hypothetical protein
MMAMRTRLLLAALLASCAPGCASSPGRPLEPLAAGAPPETSGFEGDARGFPAMRNLKGESLAEGEFTQWLEGERLHQRIRYDFGAERWIEEQSVIQQKPALVQERWSWVEMRSGAVQRRFDVDFLSGDAAAEKLEGGELHRWSAHLDVEPGQAFTGAAWALAIKEVRARLIAGETIRFQTVGFTPAPRAAAVEISHDGLDQLAMSGRTLSGDRFTIHPLVPWFARAFVEVPDSRIWLAHPPPATFLRWEGPLAEPDDALVRVDLLPGEPSGPAAPSPP